jgi:hypothetical protein
VEAKTFFFKDGWKKRRALVKIKQIPSIPLAWLLGGAFGPKRRDPVSFFSTLHQSAHVAIGLDREV